MLWGGPPLGAHPHPAQTHRGPGDAGGSVGSSVPGGRGAALRSSPHSQVLCGGRQDRGLRSAEPEGALGGSPPSCCWPHLWPTPTPPPGQRE